LLCSKTKVTNQPNPCCRAETLKRIRIQQRLQPQRLQEWEKIPYNEVDSHGELVHLTLFANVESKSFEYAMKDSRWINLIKELLSVCLL